MVRHTTKEKKGKKGKKGKKSGCPSIVYVAEAGLRGGVGGRLRRSTRYNAVKMGGVVQPRQMGRPDERYGIQGTRVGIPGGVVLLKRRGGGKKVYCKICKKYHRERDPLHPKHSRNG